MKEHSAMGGEKKDHQDGAGRQAPVSDTWYDTAAGVYALHMRTRLLQACLATWPRRGRSLLEINCGTGRLQRMFWESGFDVTGCESAPALRLRFHERLGSRFVVDPAACDLLPYPDGAFDYVVLALDGLTGPAILGTAIGEARRVAALGLAVSFWNSWSLPGLGLASATGMATWPWWRVRAALSSLHEGHISTYSALLLPRRSWGRLQGRRLRLQCLLDGPERTFLGCACALRLDLPPQRPLTASPLRLGKFLAREPGLVQEGIGCGASSRDTGPGEQLPGPR